MKTQLFIASERQTPDARHATKRAQSGVVLFIALIALVAMSLAAVALIRSVDTSTIIAGNLAFRQAATTSGDGGLESAIAALDTINSSTTKDPTTDATHPFNITSAATGYYSNADLNLSLTADATWNSGSKLVVDPNDTSGNTVRYVVQRMRRVANQKLSESNCLLSDAEAETSSKRVKPATEAGGKTSSKPPLYRITIRITGPKNTISYIQAFVY